MRRLEGRELFDQKYFEALSALMNETPALTPEQLEGYLDQRQKKIGWIAG